MRSSGCPAQRGEKGVRKACIPIHILQLCRMNGKPVQGNRLGTLLCLCPNDDILFHTSICPHFTSPFSLSYLRSGPSAQSQGPSLPLHQGSTGASITLQHHSVGTHSRGQSLVGTVSISISPKEQLFHPGAALSRHPLICKQAHRPLPITQGSCLHSKPSKAGPGQQDRVEGGGKRWHSIEKGGGC